MTSLSRQAKVIAEDEREIISRDLSALTDRLSEISRRRKTDDLRARLDNYFTLAKILALIGFSLSVIMISFALATRLVVGGFD